MTESDWTSPTPESGISPSSSHDDLQIFTASPAATAMLASRGSWKPYPHLLHLNDLLLDAAAGKIPRLMILMPPQHGKSELVSRWFPAWFLGVHPDKKVILASYEHTYAASWGRKARDVLVECGQPLFGVRIRQDVRAMDWWETSAGGAMYSAGAGGAITGKGCEVLILDDLIKNSEEASSEIVRESVWQWYLTVARSRVHDGGSIVMVCTRWHDDDPAGRLIRNMESGGERWTVVRLPAVAEEDEQFGLWTRRAGEPLCPELYSLENLRETERTVGPHTWAGLYQQQPYVVGGGFFRTPFPKLDHPVPVGARVRMWDLAASPGKGDWTVGLLLAKVGPQEFVIEDVVRGRWAPGERNAVIRRTAERDGLGVLQLFEEEPGSGGIAQSDSLRQVLAGYRARFEKATGDKTVRADPVAGYSFSGRIKVVGDPPWLREFEAELEAFPNGRYDDQVDALSGAFNWVVNKPVGTSVRRIPGRGTPPCTCGGNLLTYQQFHATWCPVTEAKGSLAPSLSDELNRLLPETKDWRN